MEEEKKKQAKPKEKPALENQIDKSINQQKEWMAIRQEWIKERTDLAQARLMQLFETDDDMPMSQHVLFVAIAGFFAFFFLWANFATLDQVTRGQGKVIPSSEVQALQSLDAGIVEEFFVHEGDEVKAGQVLVRLSDIEASSDLGASQARYYGLMAAITRLQAEAEGRQTLEFPPEVIKGAPDSVTEELNAFRANRSQLQGQLNVLEQQTAQRREEVREYETRMADIMGVIKLQEEEKAMIKPLVERGSAPKIELLQFERTIREKESELNGARSNYSRAKAALAESQARLEGAKKTAAAEAQTELAVKQAELGEIKERLSALKDRKTRTEIRSPVNGTIKELTVNTIGGVVKPGEDIIQIVPKDDQLLVEARVRPSDIAFLYPTQKAMIKISAYDFSIYGGLKGEVVNISADTIEDEKGNSFYRVRLRTYESQLKRKGEVLPIIPGMVATADILTGKKTVMQYLLKPFIKTLDKAMTER